MGLRYPNFNTREFANLHPARTADLFLKLKEVDAEIAEHARVLKEATANAGCRGKALVESIIADVTQSLSASDPRMRSYWVEEYRQSFRLNLPPGMDPKRERALWELHRAFAVFDAEKFREWFAETHPEETSRDWAKEKLSAKGKHQASLDKRKRVLAEASKAVFRDGTPPTVFRGHKAGDEGFVEAIVTAFAKDYRSRASGFGVQVTVSGTEILTLPDPIERAVWYEAYRTLGIDKLTKQPIFYANRAS